MVKINIINLFLKGKRSVVKLKLEINNGDSINFGINWIKNYAFALFVSKTWCDVMRQMCSPLTHFEVQCEQRGRLVVITHLLLSDKLLLSGRRQQMRFLGRSQRRRSVVFACGCGVRRPGRASFRVQGERRKLVRVGDQSSLDHLTLALRFFSLNTHKFESVTKYGISEPLIKVDGINLIF